MKIGFDAKRAFLNNRGLGEYSRDLISCIDKKHEIFLFTPKQENWTYNIKHRIILPKYNNYLYKIYWRNKNLIKEIKKRKINVYHGLSNELPYGIHKLNILKIVTIHDVTFKKHPYLFPVYQRLIYNKKTKYACKTADIIIAVSKQTKSDIIKYYGVNSNKIKVIYQACDEIFFKEKNQNEIKKFQNNYKIPENYILYVGAIEKRKNIKIILEVIRNNNDLNLIIAGDGNHKNKKEIKKIINKYNINNNVFFLKNLNRKDLSILYKCAICLIQPSIDEGFGRPVAECLAGGNDVIASNLNVFKEIGGNDIKYFRNYNDIIKHIKEIKKKKEKNQMKSLNKFRYSFMQQKINELYK